MRRSGSVAAVVVTYNRLAYLKECLAALKNQSLPLDEIIVVNNGSNDGTREYLIRCEGVTVINQENLGCAGGQHRGIEVGLAHEHSWLWLMDDDLVPDVRALAILLQSSGAQRSDTGAVVPSVYDKAGRRSVECAVRCGIVFRGSCLTDADLEKPELEVAAYPLLGILARAEVLRSVGNVRPEFFLYSDDIDLTLRISDQFKIWLIRDSVVVHKAAAGNYERIGLWRWRGFCYPIEGHWKEYYTWRNYIYLLRQRLNIRSILVFIWTNRMALVKNCLFADHRLERTRVYCQAVLDGFRGRLGKQIDPGDYARLWRTPRS